MCVAFTLIFVMMIGLFGAVAMKSPSWDREFHRLGHEEWERRGLSIRKLTAAEVLCQPRFVVRFSEADTDFRVRILDAIQALIGADDRSELESFLNERSDAHLTAALEEVSHAVRDISNLEVASWIWVFRRQVALAKTYGRSLLWFFPRCLKLLRQDIERYILIANILGIVLGLLSWAFGSTHEGGAHWANVLGIVVTISSVLALLLAFGKQALAVIVARFGPARAWTFKGITSGSALGISTICLIILSLTRHMQEWWRVPAEHILVLLAGTPVEAWTLSALVAAMSIFGIRNALLRASSPLLQTGDRLAEFFSIPLVIAFGTFIVIWSLGAPLRAVQSAGLVLMILYLGHCLILSVTNSASWITRYRTLRDAGINVRQGWFRWWLLWVWLASFFVVYVRSAISSATSHLPWLEPVRSLWLVWHVVMVLALMFSLPVGAIVTWRFLKRVDKCYSEFEASHSTPTD